MYKYMYVHMYMYMYIVYNHPHEPTMKSDLSVRTLSSVLAMSAMVKYSVGSVYKFHCRSS